MKKQFMTRLHLIYLKVAIIPLFFLKCKRDFIFKVRFYPQVNVFVCPLYILRGTRSLYKKVMDKYSDLFLNEVNSKIKDKKTDFLIYLRLYILVIKPT